MKGRTADDTYSLLVRVRRTFKDGIYPYYPVITRKVIDDVEYIYIGTRFRISKHYAEEERFNVEDLSQGKRSPVWKRQWTDTLSGLYLHIVGCYDENAPGGCLGFSKRGLAEMLKDKMITSARLWNMARKRERSMLRQVSGDVTMMCENIRKAVKLAAKQRG